MPATVSLVRSNVRVNALVASSVSRHEGQLTTLSRRLVPSHYFVQVASKPIASLWAPLMTPQVNSLRSHGALFPHITSYKVVGASAHTAGSVSRHEGQLT